MTHLVYIGTSDYYHSMYVHMCESVSEPQRSSASQLADTRVPEVIF